MTAVSSPSDRTLARKARKEVAKQDAERMRDLYSNPLYWASNLETKVNGVLRQVSQHFPAEHPLRQLITEQSEELSEFIHAGTADGGIPPKRQLRNELRRAKAERAAAEAEPIVAAEGLIDARTALVWHTSAVDEELAG